MILLHFSQAISKGGARGKCFEATISLQRLHMLSYAINNLCWVYLREILKQMLVVIVAR